ncbi:hypothetical protein OG239_42245 (plasmid) [Streptomyces sp. NBC_00868]|uniref:effector-associated constant component EACC1 n=1 Tax=Streptomyces sp. NBC_00868 TaxID=2903683 RepID=UPI002F9101F0|nr:hypothetical protein OG239_42245 [Streptomyces sp. NBC_00868]
MESRVVIEGNDAAVVASHLHSLSTWLGHEDELRGRIRLVEGQIEADELGGLPEALVVALSAGGAATVLAQALVEWVRQRTLDVTVKVVRASGESLEIQLSRVKAGDATVAELRRFIDQEQPSSLPDAPS